MIQTSPSVCSTIYFMIDTEVTYVTLKDNQSICLKVFSNILLITMVLGLGSFALSNTGTSEHYRLQNEIFSRRIY